MSNRLNEDRPANTEQDLPSVAVVIPCWNAEKWIARAIQSVLDQDYPNLEIIVIDDGSTDGSLEIIKSFGDRIRWETGPNRGACAARNRGLALASSTYVQFLDADDYIEGDFLGAASQALRRADADVAFCPVKVEHPDGGRATIFHYYLVPTPEEVFERWLVNYSQPPCSIVWRTDFVQSIGGWDEGLLKNQDGEFVMRAMLARPRITKFEEGWGIYNAHLSPSVSKIANPEALRSELDAIQRLMACATRMSDRSDLTGFGLKLYIIARGAFAAWDAELGGEALAACSGRWLSRSSGHNTSFRCVFPDRSKTQDTPRFIHSFINGWILEGSKFIAHPLPKMEKFSVNQQCVGAGAISRA
ncbi:MAG: glycosyltransferase [Caulobacteraceae bacterium]